MANGIADFVLGGNSPRVQAAASLRIFFLAVPAGALADIVERERLLASPSSLGISGPVGAQLLHTHAEVRKIVVAAMGNGLDTLDNGSNTQPRGRGSARVRP
jgi:hypothetical protein